MDLDGFVDALKITGLKKIDGDHSIGGKLYHVKAYKIGGPHNIIRIDLKEFSKEEIKNARNKR